MTIVINEVGHSQTITFDTRDLFVSLEQPKTRENRGSTFKLMMTSKEDAESQICIAESVSLSRITPVFESLKGV